LETDRTGEKIKCLIFNIDKDFYDKLVLNVHGRPAGKSIMNDGTMFWDINGNGKPDIVTRFDRGGNFYGNDGDGWS
jgi:hypothetical protein